MMLTEFDNTVFMIVWILYDVIFPLLIDKCSIIACPPWCVCVQCKAYFLYINMFWVKSELNQFMMKHKIYIRSSTKYFIYWFRLQTFYCNVDTHSEWNYIETTQGRKVSTFQQHTSSQQVATICITVSTRCISKSIDSCISYRYRYQSYTLPSYTSNK